MRDPENVETVGRALALFNKLLTATSVDKGTLRLQFADDAEICIPADPKYEAWELTASNGLKIVCTPGGELAIWSPQPKRV